jgi:hypothetical protein
MYRLLNRIPNGVANMLNILQEYMTNTGLEAIKSIQNLADRDNTEDTNDAHTPKKISHGFFVV